jgi:hypothetical protein
MTGYPEPPYEGRVARRRRMSFQRTAMLAVGCVVILAAVPLSLSVLGEAPAQGVRPPAPAVAQSSPVTKAPPAGAPSPRRDEAPQPAPAQTDQIGTSSARVADQPPPGEVIAPVALKVEAIGVSAPVDDVGVEPGTTAMEVPEPADRTGWYRYGPAPGDPEGVAVITAHVDSARTGRGAFFRLRELDPGAPVEVTLADGSTLIYEVTGREQLPKGELPAAELFRREGPPALALVTCGGEFDRSTGHYTDNVIVWAVPASTD